MESFDNLFGNFIILCIAIVIFIQKAINLIVDKKNRNFNCNNCDFKLFQNITHFVVVCPEAIAID